MEGPAPAEHAAVRIARAAEGRGLAVARRAGRGNEQRGLTVLALHSGTVEWVFAPAGPIATVALSDTTNRRNIVSSVVAFAVGFVLLAWLVP